MTDVDYADNLGLLVNKPAESEFLLHNREQAGRDSELYATVDKTEFMWF